MKRFAFLLLILSLPIGILADKKCPVCGGLGHAFGRSDIICSACNGSGRVPLSASEQMREDRDRENYANSVNNLMEAYNLTPEEFFAYEELMKQAMEQVPVYQTCTACNGTGNCSQCGGYMNVSLDDDLCRVCGGSGCCIACRGAGRLTVGYQENPNKEQLIQRAKEILTHGSAHPEGYNNPGVVTSSDNSFGDFDPSARSKGVPVGTIILSILGVAALGFIGYKLFKK